MKLLLWYKDEVGQYKLFHRHWLTTLEDGRQGINYINRATADCSCEFCQIVRLGSFTEELHPTISHMARYVLKE